MDAHVNDDDDPGKSKSAVMRYQFSELTKSQQILLGKVDNLNDRLLNPDTGLVVKTRTTAEGLAENTAKVTTLTRNIETLEKICTEHNIRVTALEGLTKQNNDQITTGIASVNEHLDAISASLLTLNNDLESRRTARKRIDRITGIIVVAILVCLAAAAKSWLDEMGTPDVQTVSDE